MPHIKFKDVPKKKYKCSMRLIRICYENRISRVSDFSKMTFRELLALPECGMATATQIKQILKDNGLDFRQRANKRRLRAPYKKTSLSQSL